MSTAFDHGDDANDSPFDSSYEEYVRTVEAGESDDPKATPEAAETTGPAPLDLGDGVEAPWSDLADTTEGDPFAAPGEEPGSD